MRHILQRRRASAVMSNRNRVIQEDSRRKSSKQLGTNFCGGLVSSKSTQRPMAGVDLTDSSSAAGADDFDPITENPTSQQVTVATATVKGAPRGEKEREMPIPFKSDR